MREVQPSLRVFLRTRTRDAHEAVDAAFAALDLTERRQYALFLTCSARALSGIETALDVSPATLSLVADWPARRRMPALADDLAELGLPLPPSLPAPAFDDPASCLGALYVLEGSRLGASFLARRVAESPDAELRAATRYLNHGSGSSLWPRFLAVLSGDGAQSLDRRAILDGAHRAFRCFQDAAPLAEAVG